jgi:lysozyme family protein
LQTNFDLALTHVLQFEGGYSDHPSDPGGATNLGITKAVLETVRGRPVTKQEVRALSKDEAAEIYRRFYWLAAACDQLPDGVDLAVFDCAVNQGVGRAARFLQQAAGVTADGAIGPKTLAAAKAAQPGELLVEFMARRMHSYGLLQKLFKVFGLGWSRRLMATHAAALSLRAGRATAGSAPLQNSREVKP